MARKAAISLLVVCVSSLALGCGSDVAPGVNKGKDKPVPAEQPAEKK